MSPHFTRVVKEVYGYRNVKYMVAGHKTWQGSINPYFTEPEFVRMAQDEDIAHILVDLRSADKATKEHIEGAVNFPVDEDLNGGVNTLSDALKSAKIKYDARIIYYSDDQETAEQVHMTMRANYWENGYILNGGMKAWKDKGYPVAGGSPSSNISYDGKTTLPGALSLSEFEEVALATPANTVIIDVRSPGEWESTGIVPGSMVIPIDTLHRRYTEVPKDKNIIVYCAAGNRALQIWRLLRNKGYENVQWVDGKPTKSKKGILQKGLYVFQD